MLGLMNKEIQGMECVWVGWPWSNRKLVKLAWEKVFLELVYILVKNMHLGERCVESPWPNPVWFLGLGRTQTSSKFP